MKICDPVNEGEMGAPGGGPERINGPPRRFPLILDNWTLIGTRTSVTLTKMEICVRINRKQQRGDR